MTDKPAAEEFFYLDSAGTKQDAELHNAILNPVDFPIDEKIMNPIREKNRAKWKAEQDQQRAEQRQAQKAAKLKSQWQRAKARAQALLKYDDSEPRDDSGKWTDGGGGSDSESGGKGKLGPGYSEDAKLKNGVIHTSNVYDAVLALSQNRKVELKQPKQLSTLIKKLGEVTKEMAEKGEKAKVFDLCNVTVKGTNLFCADSKGIPRVKMPQMDVEQTKAFIQHLKDEGYKVEKTKEKSENLRATQSQLDGAKVARLAHKIEKDPERENTRRLVVSRDDYILDGHHHWGAQIAVDAKDNKLGDHHTKITRVDISITKLLEEANKFTGGKGGKDVGKALASLEKGQNGLYKLWNEADHPREPAGGPGGGEFSGGGGGGGKEDSGKPVSAAGGAAAGNAGSVPRSFARESPDDAQRGRGVVSVFTPTTIGEGRFRAAGHTPQTFHELGGDAGAKAFNAAISAAKASATFGAAVHAYAPDEYKGMRLFLTPDGKNGFALKGDDIVSLFKNSNATGVAGVSLKLATEEGGRRLDAFDTALPFIYAKAGFEPVARLKWNEEYKPEGWDKATFKEFNKGEPDVVFMNYTGSSRQTYTPGSGAYVKDYDEGTAEQQRTAYRQGDLESKPPPPPSSEPANAIDPKASVDEKVAQLQKLTAVNKPIIDSFAASIDKQLGTKSEVSIKKPETIKSKATRPDVLRKKPWFGVEHIRDSLRFRTAVDSFKQVPDIVKALQASGQFDIVKYDYKKLTEPKEWGSRVLPIDLKTKNGQMVEYYLVSKEQRAVLDEGHALFDKWRDANVKNLSRRDTVEYQKDVATSNKLYGGAWAAYLKRTGQTPQDVLNAVKM